MSAKLALALDLLFHILNFGRIYRTPKTHCEVLPLVGCFPQWATFVSFGNRWMYKRLSIEEHERKITQIKNPYSLCFIKFWKVFIHLIYLKLVLWLLMMIWKVKQHISLGFTPIQFPDQNSYNLPIVLCKETTVLPSQIPCFEYLNKTVRELFLETLELVWNLGGDITCWSVFPLCSLSPVFSQGAFRMIFASIMAPFSSKYGEINYYTRLILLGC